MIRRIYPRRSIVVYVSFTGMIVWSFLLTACSKEWSDPQAVLTRYLNAVYERDLEEVYAHLSSRDRSHRSLEKFIRYHSTEDSIVVGPLMRRTTFRIESLQTDGTRARAIVEVTQPNLEIVMNDMMDVLFSSIGKGMSPREFDRLLTRRYRGRAVPMTTARKGYGLVNEEGKWRISAGWPEEEAVGALLMRGMRLEEEGHLKEARIAYEKALRLNDHLIEVEEKIRAIDARLDPSLEPEPSSQEMIRQILENRRHSRRRQ